MDASRIALIKAGEAASEKRQAHEQRRADRQERFRTLCESGKSREEIAAVMGVGVLHVRDHARKYGYPIPPVTRPHAKHGLKPGQKLGKRKPKENRNA